MVDVFIETSIKDFNNKTKAQNTERANIIGEIDALNKRYQNALLKNADGEMADDDFQEVKKCDKSIVFRLVPRSDPAGIGSAPQSPRIALSLQRIEPIPTLRSTLKGTKKAQSFD